MRNQEKPGIKEKIFAVFVLLYSSTAFFSFLKDTNEQQLGAATGSFATDSIWIIVYLGTGFLLVKHWDRLKRVWRQIPFLSILTMFAVVSFLWSEFPLSSALHIAALLGTTVVGLYLGLRYDLKEMLHLLGWSLGIEAVASFLMSWLVPSHGIGTGQSEDLWIGVFPHKITLGREMALAFLVFALLGQASRRRRMLYWGFCLLSLALIFFADAATAKVSCVFMVSLILYNEVVSKNVKSPFRRFAIVSLAVCLGSVLVYLNSDRAFDFLARDDNFSGRTLIWYTVWGSVQERPLLGYGYGGFWVGLDGPSMDVSKATGVVYGHAHNGYLNLWVNCGIVGLFLFFLCVADALRKGLTRSLNRTEEFASWPFYLFLFLLIQNVTDSTFLEINQSFWIIFIAVLIQLSEGKKRVLAMTGMPGLLRSEAHYGLGKVTC